MNSSLWQATGKDQSFDTLSHDLAADVVIVGGGITGVTTAALLAEAGYSVAVLEAYRVGQGTSGCSTGNLYATVDQHLFELRNKWGTETAQAVTDSRRTAMDRIAALVGKHGIDCAHAPQPWYLFTETADAAAEETLLNEYDALRQFGLDAERVPSLPLPFNVHEGVMLPAQAQFHPLRYVAGLAAAVQSPRCRIFEDSAVLDIDDERRILKTARATVAASKIVMATHTPKGFHLIQTELGPYSEHGVAARVASAMPGGIYWSLGETEHSIRGYVHDGVPYVMAIGASHKTGQAEDTHACYAEMETYLRTRFDISAVTHRWTAQNFRPADSLPYIGLLRGADDIYVATGFATDGLVYGTLAAMLISDAIAGIDNPWAELYSARRFTPIKSAAEFASENANVAAQYLKDFTRNLPEAELDSIAPGEGRLVEHDGRKVAVSRGDDGRISALSPLCTHLKCIVHWNTAEKTWDCPCHGSRFSATGAVLEGPALKGLERLFGT